MVKVSGPPWRGLCEMGLENGEEFQGGTSHWLWISGLIIMGEGG